MLEEILQEVLKVVPTIIAILVAYGVSNLKKYIDYKITNQEMNEWLDGIIDALEDAVNLTAQEYTSSLKKKQGSLTETQQIIALQKAKEKFYASIDESSKQILENVYGNLDNWIEERINVILGASKL